jgi:hypothetical protein
MTRYGGWDDPRWEDPERTAGERWRSEQRSDPREPREQREWGAERRERLETGGRYGAGRSVGWRREERQELDPPWVERGPEARRAGNDRGLVEWEDRGPLQWLGDKIREARRSRGPKGYRRSDERVEDAVCERIARSDIDASEVEVKVENGEVTLTGTVRSRRDKWWLEEMVDDVFGVEEVHNRLRLARPDTMGRAGEAGPSEPTDLRH